MKYFNDLNKHVASILYHFLILRCQNELQHCQKSNNCSEREWKGRQRGQQCFSRKNGNLLNDNGYMCAIGKSKTDFLHFLR